MRRPRPHSAPSVDWIGLVDLHSHVLPGLDDGAETIEESIEIARAAERDGIRVLAATPHVREDYPTQAATMLSLVDEVQARLDAEGVAVDLRPGGEIAFGILLDRGLDELRQFCLAGNPQYLLIEAPYVGWPLGIAETFFRLRLAGVTPVLAHPERNPHVQDDPERLRSLVDSGALVQLTASSLDGRAGKGAARAARRLLEAQLVHLVASDAHRPGVRAVGMTAALDAVADAELADWLGRAVPAAIADARQLPERPAARSRRGRAGRRTR